MPGSWKSTAQIQAAALLDDNWLDTYTNGDYDIDLNIVTLTYDRLHGTGVDCQWLHSTN